MATNIVIVTLDRTKTADNVADWPWCAVYITMVGYRYSCINPTWYLSVRCRHCPWRIFVMWIYFGCGLWTHFRCGEKLNVEKFRCGEIWALSCQVNRYYKSYYYTVRSLLQHPFCLFCLHLHTFYVEKNEEYQVWHVFIVGQHIENILISVL